MIALEISHRIQIAKHWLDVAGNPNVDPSVRDHMKDSARRMGRNECAWILHQEDQKLITLPEATKHELQSLVARNSPAGRSVNFTSFEALPVVANMTTAMLSQNSF